MLKRCKPKSGEVPVFNGGLMNIHAAVGENVIAVKPSREKLISPHSKYCQCRKGERVLGYTCIIHIN